MATLKELLISALELPVNERAVLAENLLASLDDLSEAESDRLWAEVAQRRMKALREGRAGSTPAEKVHERVARLYQ